MLPPGLDPELVERLTGTNGGELTTKMGVEYVSLSAEHSHAEHVAIVDALEKRDARAAVRLMDGHLTHVERDLRLHPRMSDLAQVLRP